MRLDPAFRSVVQSVRLAPSTRRIRPAGREPDGHRLWRGLDRTPYGAVARVDARSHEVTAPIPVGNGPTSIATGAGGVWVTDAVDNTVTQLDPASAAPRSRRTPVGQGPTAIAVGEGAVWVANTQDDTVSRIDPRTLDGHPHYPGRAQPDGHRGGRGRGVGREQPRRHVSRIDPEANRVEATVEVGAAPQGVTVAHDLVWVTVQASAAAPDRRPVGAGRRGGRVSSPETADPALERRPPAQRGHVRAAVQQPRPPLPRGLSAGARGGARAPLLSDGGRTYRSGSGGASASPRPRTSP